MKIKYEFADGTVSEVEVEESIGVVIIEDALADKGIVKTIKQRINFSSAGVVKYSGIPAFSHGIIGEAVRW